MANQVISFRIDPELLAAIDAQAEADGTTRNQILILAIRQRLVDALTPETIDPRNHPTRAAAQSVNYERPAHDPTCKCGMCKP